MANQGKITRKIAKMLSNDRWNVIYTCIPNTPHINVVPIPSVKGISQQRYPDILAYRNGETLLVEVEISLSKGVALDIIDRFNDQIKYLSIRENWKSWSEHVTEQTVYKLPDSFSSKCLLILCTGNINDPNLIKDVSFLETNSIIVHTEKSFNTDSLS